MRFSVLSVCALAAAGATTALAGQFTTSNGQIYDPNGNLFVARGVNIPGQNYWTAHDPTADVTKIVDNWGFNMVRVIDQPVAGWSAPGANINLDNIVNAYTARGVVVVIEAHESTGSYFEGAQLTQAANWFATQAQKYKNNPYVWFNTGNEPGDQWVPDGNKWLTMQRTIMSAIRGTGAQNIMVADGTNYGQDQAWNDLGTLNPAHSAVLTYGPTIAGEYSNVVFDTHIYGEWSSPNAISQRLPQYIEAARAANLPLIFGEYGATVFGDWYQTQVDFLKVANQYNLGRVAWSWSDSKGWNFTTSQDPNAIGTDWQYGGGYLINSPTNPTNLTPFGQLVWDDTHAVMLVPEPATGMVAVVGATLAVGARRRRGK